MADRPEIVTKTDARAGATHQGVRYVLAISLLLAFIGFIIAFVVTPEETAEGSANAYRQPGGEDRPVQPGANPGGGPGQGNANPG